MLVIDDIMGISVNVPASTKLEEKPWECARLKNIHFYCWCWEKVRWKYNGISVEPCKPLPCYQTEHYAVYYCVKNYHWDSSVSLIVINSLVSDLSLCFSYVEQFIFDENKSICFFAVLNLFAIIKMWKICLYSKYASLSVHRAITWDSSLPVNPLYTFYLDYNDKNLRAGS